METKTKNKSERLTELYNKYGLLKEDYFQHSTQKWVIITRTGIDKIEAELKGYTVSLDMIHITDDHKYCIVKATIKNNNTGLVVESYGESSPSNNKNAYPVAIAEKRARSRAVLKLVGFYALNVYSEDESDDFRRGKELDTLDENHPDWDDVCMKIKTGSFTLDQIKQYYDISATVEYKLMDL